MDNFVKEIKHDVWSSVLLLYDRSLQAKAKKMKKDKMKDLIKLDNWFQNDLAEVITSRKKKHITQEELCNLMRGKFRPRLTEMVQLNSEESVVEASTAAFQKLPDIDAAIKELTVLKAIGPATASAVLAAGAPKHAAFMADESMQALPGLYPIKYDLPFYRQYMKQVSTIVKQLNKQDSDKSWTPHKVELTLWTYQVARTLDPDILLSDKNGHKDTESTEPPKKKAKS